MTRNTRFRLTALACTLVAASGLWLGRHTLRAQPTATAPAAVFQGTSPRGQFAEALENALRAADRAGRQRHIDYMYEWRLLDVTGRRGGIAGFNTLTVRIEVRG